MQQHEKINYVEFPASDIAGTKAFFEQAFGWVFTDYGPEYAAFDQQGVEGGFFKSDLNADTARGSALIVFYSNDLNSTLAKVTTAGGKIVRDVFEFPGGRRFHFTCPSNNEFAVWSDR